MIMRWIFAIFMVAVGIFLIRSDSTRHLAIRRILFMLFVILGLLSLIFQDSWTNLARLLGVESGTALLTYLVTFSFISYVISSFRWKRKLEAKLVQLTREIAIKNQASD